jgi:hypothetical protein
MKAMKVPSKTKIKRRYNMDFEKAYEKFLNGSATAEEVEFVRSEMKKANDVNNVLNNVKNEGATKLAEKETVKRAMKLYWKKDTVKILVIVCAAVLALAIAVSMAVGIPILSSAKGNVHYSKEDAKALAIEAVSSADTPASEIEVLRVERELEVEGRIKNARYIYVIELSIGARTLEIEVDGKTGKILEIDD